MSSEEHEATEIVNELKNLLGIKWRHEDKK
jgi:hypothetical protein